MLNNSMKFAYNNPVSVRILLVSTGAVEDSQSPPLPRQSILEDIRAYRIPADFVELFDEAGVPYYDGLSFC